MKKALLIIFILTQVIFANGLQIIDKISDIPQNKNVVLIFSMKYCPYCKRQERSILKKVQPKFKDIVYLKVMKGTKVFEELNDTGNFDEIKYFPTTFILKIDKENNMNIKYLFMGLQRSRNIMSVLSDNDIMED